MKRLLTIGSDNRIDFENVRVQTDIAPIILPQIIGCKIIHNTRTDKIRRAVSSAICEKNRIITSDHVSNDKKTAVIYDFDLIYRHLVANSEYDAKIRTLFTELDFDVMEVTYEELIANTPEVIASIYNFLDVDGRSNVQIAEAGIQKLSNTINARHYERFVSEYKLKCTGD